MSASSSVLMATEVPITDLSLYVGHVIYDPSEPGGPAYLVADATKGDMVEVNSGRAMPGVTLSQLFGATH